MIFLILNFISIKISSWIITPSVPCNLKIQSANHSFFLFVSYLYEFKKLKFIAEVQVHCQELEVKTHFLS